MDFMTRRSMLAALIATAGGGPALAAQLGAKKKDDKKPTPGKDAAGAPAAMPPGPNPLGRLMGMDESKDQTLTMQLTVSAFNELDSRGLPVIGKLRFDTAAVVFPIIRGCASSLTDLSKVTGELKFNDQVVSTKAAFAENYQAGTRLGRWEMKDKVGSEVQLKVVIPMTAWGTKFDEMAAMMVKWPGTYPKPAASTLEADPLADAHKNRILDPQAPEIAALLKKWTSGKDPKALPPVQLAKFLLGQVVEHVQPSGDGLRFGDVGAFEGIELQPAAITAVTGKCTEHDVPNFLATIYRAAGLPARTVMGYDNDDGSENKKRFLQRKKGAAAIRSWVEFALYDEAGKQELWVPVDPFRQRRSGTRVPGLDRPWEYFGGISDLVTTLPFAFQYHPPTTVVAHGYPAFWGWLTTPELQVAEQKLLFTATSTPKRGGEAPRGTGGSDPNAPAPRPKK